MKRKTRVISLLLALLTAAVLLHAGSLVSYADTFFEDGDFRFAVVSGDRLLVAQYKGGDTDIVLPDSVGGRAVTGVYKNCFQGTAVESVTLPEGYTSIGAFAFNGCEHLAEVALPSTLESIGIMAFSGCTTLSGVDFEAAESLQTLSFAAFNGCTALERVILPDSLTAIGQNAFCNCAALAQIGLPENLTEIPEYAFFGTAVEEVNIPASVTSVGAHAFDNCAALGSVFVPDTVETVGDTAFAPHTEIVCFTGSAAAEYCRGSGRENAQIVEKLFGDANLDGDVNVNDVTSIQRCLAELEQFGACQAVLADVNKDGRVNVDDATMIQMYLAEFDVVLG